MHGHCDAPAACAIGIASRFEKNVRDGVVQAPDNLSDVFIVDDKGWRQQDVIASQSVRGSTGWITNETPLEGPVLDLHVEAESGVERLFLAAIGNQFQGAEQTTAANFPDVRMVAEAVMERPIQALALTPYIIQQISLDDGPLHGQSRRTGRSVTHVGVTMLKISAAVTDPPIDGIGRENRTDRLIPGAEPFRDDDQIRCDAFLLRRKQRPGSPHPRHHFVQDEQHAIAIADLMHPFKIAGDGRGGTDR